MSLADRIVALGVGRREGSSYAFQHPTAEEEIWLTSEQFTHSWEVAGALMERCWPKLESIIALIEPDMYRPSKKARAIILACVEELES